MTDTDTNDTDRIDDTEIVSRDGLKRTGETEYGPTYRCPRCGHDWVTEHCDCPECLWAGMCQEGWA